MKSHFLVILYNKTPYLHCSAHVGIIIVLYSDNSLFLIIIF